MSVFFAAVEGESQGLSCTLGLFYICHFRGEKLEVRGERNVQVVLIHEKNRQQMDNFLPGKFNDLDGKAFAGPLGEFLISCVKVEEMVTKDDLFIDSLQIIANAAEVKRLMVVGDSDHIYNKVREALRKADPDKHITVFTMQPMDSGNFRQEILGYSLMAALGIKSEELNKVS